MLMDSVLSGFIYLLGVILIITVVPIRVQLLGKIQLVESLTTGEAKILIGYKNRGLGLDIYPAKMVSVGSYSKPFWSFQLKSNPKKQTSQKKKGPSSMNRIKSIQRLPIGRIVKSLSSSIHFEQLSLTGKIGLTNSFYTGIIYGWVNGISHLPKFRSFYFDVVPKFINGNNTDLTGNLHLRFSPAFTALKAGIIYFKHRK